MSLRPLRPLRRRWVALAAAAVLALAAQQGSARAATALQVSVPGTVGYYRIVDVHGTGASPGAVVAVGFRHVGRSGWTEHPVRADGAGTFTLGFPLTGDTEVRARQGSATSPTQLVRIVRASCRTTGAAFPAFGRPYWSTTPFAYFSVTRAGRWAGVALVDARAYLVSWSPGTPVRVRDTFDYFNGSYQPGQPGSVNVVGIGPQGQLVVAADVTHTNAGRFRGYLYGGVHRTTLASSPRWVSVRPTGMSDDGVIVGEVQYAVGAKQGYAVVEWTAGGSHVRVVHDNSRQPVIDRAGDITYSTLDGYAVVVTSAGVTRPLPSRSSPDGSASSATVSGGPHTVFGRATNDPARWSISPTARPSWRPSPASTTRSPRRARTTRSSSASRRSASRCGWSPRRAPWCRSPTRTRTPRPRPESPSTPSARSPTPRRTAAHT